MHPRLRALVRVDLPNKSVAIDVRGSFTTTNYRGLLPLIRRAHALPGNPTVTVNLTRAPFTESKAFELLTQACAALPSSADADAIPLRIVDDNAFTRRERTAQISLATTASSYSLAS